jgi:hypothetical protein
MGKSAYEKLIAPHVVKHSGGLTLAPDGDPRARVIASRSAQEAFNTQPAKPSPGGQGDNSW